MMQIAGTALFVFFGTYLGLPGVLLAIIVRAIMVAVYNVAALRTEIGLSVSALLQSLVPPVIASGVMVVAVRVVKAEFEGVMPGFFLLAAMVAAGIVVFPAAMLLGDLAGAWRG
jgi:hypothetical protein